MILSSSLGRCPGPGGMTAWKKVGFILRVAVFGGGGDPVPSLCVHNEHTFTSDLPWISNPQFLSAPFPCSALTCTLSWDLCDRGFTSACLILIFLVGCLQLQSCCSASPILSLCYFTCDAGRVSSLFLNIFYGVANKPFDYNRDVCPETILKSPPDYCKAPERRSLFNRLSFSLLVYVASLSCLHEGMRNIPEPQKWQDLGFS